MKHLNRFLVASLLIMTVGSMSAQNETNPWAISGGVNVVDFFPPNQDSPSEISDLSEELFNSNNTLNIAPTLLSYVNVSRYIGKRFTVGVTATLNEIDRFEKTKARDLFYAGIDGEVSYSFKEILKSRWIDPYVQLGGGATKVEGNRVFGTANGGAGVRLWVNKNISLGAKTIYKQEFDNTIEREHFQHVFSLGVSFGGKDTDGDGTNDSEDSCPAVFGLAEFNGCPDSDGDGIKDSEDTCPNVAGLPEHNGCSDIDGDGIPDNKDACPKIAGINSLGGCPDTDGDGVKDSDDSCPTVKGQRINNGCPHEDSDSDGVLDKDDHCPMIAGIASQNGCPKIEVENKAANLKISADVINDLNIKFRSVLFDNNKATIRSESYGTLANIASIMKKYTTDVFLIEGHTDDKGSDSYNLKLSGERAASVRNYLAGKGIPSYRIQSKGFGETRPISSNNTESGRQTNRRVELSVISK